MRIKYDGSYAKLQAAVEDFVRTVSTLSTAGRPPAVAIFASFPYLLRGIFMSTYPHSF